MAGAPPFIARSGLLPLAVDKSLEHHELPVLVKPKLPKIDLPKFAGEMTKFHSFWEGFKSSLDSNTGLSTIHKFNYLKALLEGSAARSIQGLALTESNYAAAIDILKK